MSEKTIYLAPKQGVRLVYALEGLTVDATGAHPDCQPVLLTWEHLEFRRESLKLPSDERIYLAP